MSQLNNPIAVYGLGKSGKAALRLLKNIGFTSEIEVIDEQSTETTFEGFPIQKKLDPTKKYGTLIVSPGVSLLKPDIRAALERGARLESEITVSLDYLTSEKRIGVTGSMGKSTTSALIHRGIEAAGKTAFLGGNFGVPLADYVSDVLEKIHARSDYLVLELSSYQLENAGALEIDVSVIVSLAANHLERYESLQDYYDTKLSLIRRTKSFVVFGSRSPDLNQVTSDREKLNSFVRHSSVVFQKCDNPENKTRLAALSGSPKLPGEHNHDNLLIASQVLADLELEGGLPALLDFEGLEHRLENLGLRRGIEAFNDSKATSITSVHRAIETLCQARPGKKIHCLVGGRDKKLPWKTLGDFPGRESVVFYFFGECAELAQRDSGLPGRNFQKLAPAVKDCVRNAGPGEIILLSPGGTSLDEFKNFEKRGESFKMMIEDLLGPA